VIEAEQYLQYLDSEYLTEYIPAGGAAVKFAVTEAGSADIVREGLLSRARSRGYVVATVNAAQVKIHMIDKVFNAVATQIDWDEGARAVVRSTLQALGFQSAPDGELSLEHLAAANDYDANELRIELNRELQREILKDYELAHEFRIAMLRLCQAVLDHSESMREERNLVLEWLRGEVRLVSTLKQVRIYQKIARHNARDMLTSLTHWVAKTGRPGLVLDLDLRRCAVSKRPDDGLVFYSRVAVLDTYEFLRQLIDATDELKSCLVLATISPDILTDPFRGIEHNYEALKYRIWDEVRDSQRTNPLAALVRTASFGTEQW
jgi:P-loop Domain of unknown function (DUF2791)